MSKTKMHQIRPLRFLVPRQHPPTRLFISSGILSSKVVGIGFPCSYSEHELIYSCRADHLGLYTGSTTGFLFLSLLCLSTPFVFNSLWSFWYHWCDLILEC